MPVRSIRIRRRAGLHSRLSLADLLAADPGGVGQVPLLCDAGRQRRRGWHSHPDVAGDPQRLHPLDTAADHPRPDWWQLLLWRGGDHSGDVGDVGHRGSEHSHPRPRPLYRHPFGAGADPAVCHPETWHRHGGQAVCPHHADLVYDVGGAGAARHHPQPRGAGGAQPHLGGALLCPVPDHLLLCPRRRGAGHHRGGGALRGYGPLWQESNSPRLVYRGAALAGAQLLRSGGAAAEQPCRHCQPLLPARAEMGAGAAAAAGNHGDGDRLAGGDLRGLFADPAGGAPRLSLPHSHRSYLRAGVRPDLYSGHQLDALYLGGDRHHELRALQQSGCGLRHRRNRHHGAHLHPLLLGGQEQLALEQVSGGYPVCRAALYRRAALCRQPRQDLLRRLAAAHPGHGDVHRDDQLEERAFPAYSPPERARQLP